MSKTQEREFFRQLFEAEPIYYGPYIGDAVAYQILKAAWKEYTSFSPLELAEEDRRLESFISPSTFKIPALDRIIDELADVESPEDLANPVISSGKELPKIRGVRRGYNHVSARWHYNVEIIADDDSADAFQHALIRKREELQKIVDFEREKEERVFIRKQILSLISHCRATLSSIPYIKKVPLSLRPKDSSGGRRVNIYQGVTRIGWAVDYFSVTKSKPKIGGLLEHIYVNNGEATQRRNLSKALQRIFRRWSVEINSYPEIEDYQKAVLGTWALMVASSDAIVIKNLRRFYQEKKELPEKQQVDKIDRMN